MTLQVKRRLKLKIRSKWSKKTWKTFPKYLLRCVLRYFKTIPSLCTKTFLALKTKQTLIATIYIPSTPNSNRLSLTGYYFKTNQPEKPVFYWFSLKVISDGLDLRSFTKGIDSLMSIPEESVKKIFHTFDPTQKKMGWEKFIKAINVIEAKSLKAKIDLFMKVDTNNFKW